MSTVNIRTHGTSCSVRHDGMITLDSRKRRHTMADEGNLAEIKFANGIVTMSRAENETYNITMTVTGNVPGDSESMHGAGHWLCSVALRTMSIPMGA